MSLTDYLIARISADGPMSVADYMSACLLHPEFGYYATRDPFGTAGDFITAPEISQMFGELAGLALAQAWMDRAGPDQAAPDQGREMLLVEPGPGRGTLMADMLRVMRQVSGQVSGQVSQGGGGGARPQSASDRGLRASARSAARDAPARRARGRDHMA